MQPVMETTTCNPTILEKVNDLCFDADRVRARVKNNVPAEYVATALDELDARSAELRALLNAND